MNLLQAFLLDLKDLCQISFEAKQWRPKLALLLPPAFSPRALRAEATVAALSAVMIDM